MMRLTMAGREVAVCDWGRSFDPDRPSLLLLHGAGMDHTVWALQGRALAFHGCNALAPDLPGHGANADLDACARIEAHAEWLHRLLDILDLAEVTLVGHSMGALVALEAAAGDPRVRGLVLLGAALRMPVHPDLLEAARSDLPRAAALIVDWGFAPRSALGAQPVPGGWTPGAAAALLLRSRPGVLARDLAACNEYLHGPEAARAVSVPALVLAGVEDRMTPARAGGELARSLPRGGFRSLPGAGHMLMLERPREVLTELRGFLAERPARPAGAA